MRQEVVLVSISAVVLATDFFKLMRTGGGEREFLLNTLCGLVARAEGAQHLELNISTSPLCSRRFRKAS